MRGEYEITFVLAHPVAQTASAYMSESSTRTSAWHGQKYDPQTRFGEPWGSKTCWLRSVDAPSSLLKASQPSSSLPPLPLPRPSPPKTRTGHPKRGVPLGLARRRAVRPMAGPCEPPRRGRHGTYGTSTECPPLRTPHRITPPSGQRGVRSGESATGQVVKSQRDLRRAPTTRARRVGAARQVPD